MKKLILLVLVVLGVWVGVNYVRTGKLSLFPPAMSEEAQKLHDLQEELDAVNSQIAAAGRSAGMTGLDTTADVEALMIRKGQIEEKMAEARKKVR